MTEIIEKLTFGRSRREITIMVTLAFAIFIATIWFAIKFVNPAPPSRVVIAAGDGEGDYTANAEKYRDLMLKDGITLDIRHTSGAKENADLIKDPASDVQVAFVQDGLLTQEEAPRVASLGSMYYEPLWIFVNTRGANASLNRLSRLVGKTISLGESGSGTQALALRLLEASGISEKNTRFLSLPWQTIHQQLLDGRIDAAFYIGPPDDDLVDELVSDPRVRLMSLDNAEAMQRRLPFLHHLVLPHGAIDLARNRPPADTEMVAPTATLLIKRNIHPALIHLILKAATAVHSNAGVFEKPNEFPSDKDYEIDLSEDAREFYKNGAPAWHRYLPFWLATLLERLVVVAVPFFAVILPALRMIPRFFNWRARRKILGRYAELKFIEVEMRKEPAAKRVKQYVNELKKVEDKVRQLRVPLEFADQLYGLRANIKMVREQIGNYDHRIADRASVDSQTEPV